MRLSFILLLSTACIDVKSLEQAVNQNEDPKESPVDINISVEILTDGVDIQEGNDSNYTYDSILTCVVYNNEEQVPFDDDTADVYVSGYTWYLNGLEVNTPSDQNSFGDDDTYRYGYKDTISCKADIKYKEMTNSESHIDYDGDDTTSEVTISNTEGTFGELKIQKDGDVEVVNSDTLVYNDDVLLGTISFSDPDVFTDSKESFQEVEIIVSVNDQEAKILTDDDLPLDENGIVTLDYLVDMAEFNIYPNDSLSFEFQVTMDDANIVLQTTSVELGVPSITIANRLPEESTVAVNISGETKQGETLTCSALSSDGSDIIDPDDKDISQNTSEEFQIAYYWEHNGTEILSAEDGSRYQSSTLDISSEYNKGSSIKCVAELFDRHTTENPVPFESQPVEILNTSPVINDVITSIVDENGNTLSSPTTDVDLHCSYTGSPVDLDDDSLIPNFVWISDGVEISQNEVLDSDDTAKDQSYSCKVRFTDGEEDSYSNYSDDSSSVTISNSAPFINNVTTSIVDVNGNVLTNPQTDVDLHCTSSGTPTDADSEDTVLTPIYSWISNNTEISNTQVLTSSETTKDQTYYCKVKFSDGESESDYSNESPPTTIANTPPVVTTVSITTNSSPVYSGDELTCFVSTEDTDGDDIALTYQWLRQNADLSWMDIPNTDSDTYTPSELATYSCEALPFDGDDDGTKVQSDNSVTVQNSVPQFVMSPTLVLFNENGESSIFNCGAAVEDSDSDQEIDYSFQLFSDEAGEINFTGVSTSPSSDGEVATFNLNFSDYDPFINDDPMSIHSDVFYCEVTVTDGYETISDSSNEISLEDAICTDINSKTTSCTECHYFEDPDLITNEGIQSNFAPEGYHVYELPEFLVNIDLVVTDTTEVIFIDEECNEINISNNTGNQYQYGFEGVSSLPRYVKVGQSDPNSSQYHIHLMESNPNNGGGTNNCQSNLTNLSTTSANAFNIGTNSSIVYKLDPTSSPYMNDLITSFKVFDSDIEVELLDANCAVHDDFLQFNQVISAEDSSQIDSGEAVIIPRHLIFDYQSIGPVYLRLTNTGTVENANGQFLFGDNLCASLNVPAGSTEQYAGTSDNVFGCKRIELNNSIQSADYYIDQGEGKLLFLDDDGNIVYTSHCSSEDCIPFDYIYSDEEEGLLNFDECNSTNNYPTKVLVLKESSSELGVQFSFSMTNQCNNSDSDCIIGNSFVENGLPTHTLGSEEEYQLCPEAGLWLEISEPTGTNNEWKVEVGTDGQEGDTTNIGFFQNVSIDGDINPNPFEAAMNNEITDWEDMASSVASFSGQCHNMLTHVLEEPDAFLNGSNFSIYVNGDNNCDQPQYIYVKNEGSEDSTFYIRSSARAEYNLPSYVDSPDDCHDLDEDGDGMNDCEELGCKDGMDNNNNDIKDCYESGCTQICDAYDEGFNTGWIQKFTTSLPPVRSECYMTFDKTMNKVVMFGGKGSNGELSDLWVWDGEESDWISVSISAGTITPGYQEGSIFYYDENNQFTSYLYDSMIWRLNHNPLLGFSWSTVALSYSTSYPRYAWSGSNLIISDASSTTNFVEGFGDSMYITQVETSSNPSPSTLVYTASTYDPNVGIFTLGGAYSTASSYIYNNAYYWNDNETSWQSLSYSERPVGKYGATLDNYPPENLNVMFGGVRNRNNSEGNGNIVYTDETLLLQFDANKNFNSEFLLSPLSPPPRAFHCSAYDQERQEIVVFGGQDIDLVKKNDTWVFRMQESE